MSMKNELRTWTSGDSHLFARLLSDSRPTVLPTRYLPHIHRLHGACTSTRSPRAAMLHHGMPRFVEGGADTHTTSSHSPSTRTRTFPIQPITQLLLKCARVWCPTGGALKVLGGIQRAERPGRDPSGSLTLDPTEPRRSIPRSRTPAVACAGCQM
jgi:hypothetical protein